VNTTSQGTEARWFQELRTDFGDAVIGPDDAAYDEARKVFYSGIDRRPAAFVRPADAPAVARAVTLARKSGLELAVRSGGHSVVGYGICDGGIVLDLSRLRGLDIDADDRTAWAGTGLTAGEYTAAVGAHGLATGFGDAPSVGIGGITLGGGIGFLHRKFGLTIDSLVAAEVVTADGSIVHTDADTHPDLFWAIRGGGGNFGVATRFRFRLHEVGAVYGGMLILPATADAIASFVSEALNAPDPLTCIAMVMPAPPMPFIPAEQHGRPIIFAQFVYAGPSDAGERALAPFRALATPIIDGLRTMQYHEVYEQGEAPRPAAVAVRNVFTDRLDRAAAETILDHLERSDAPMRIAQIRVLGGAVARVPEDATAFAHRKTPLMVILAAAYNDMAQESTHEAWVSQFAARLPGVRPGAYVGFLGRDGAERMREAYPGATWDRLAAIKARYDPTNLFHRNGNIPPTE